MRVIRSSKNHKLMLEIDNEAERQLLKRLFDRALNTWEPPIPCLLKIYDDIQRPLGEATGCATRFYGYHFPKFLDPLDPDPKYGVFVMPAAQPLP